MVCDEAGEESHGPSENASLLRLLPGPRPREASLCTLPGPPTQTHVMLSSPPARVSTSWKGWHYTLNKDNDSNDRLSLL